MAKRILFFLALLLLGSSGPGFPPVVARFAPIPLAAAQAAPPTAEKDKEKSEAEKAGEKREADECEVEEEGLGETLEEMLEDTGAAIDKTHARISRGLLATAEWFDSFFIDERIASECQRSHLRLSFSALVKEREGVKYDVRPNFRLELPVLQNRLNFLLAADEEEKEFQPPPLQEVRQRFLDTSRTSFSASLRYFFESSLERNISAQVGVRVPHVVPTLFIEPRYRQSHTFDSWLLRFTQRVIALMDGSVEVRTTFDLDRPVTDKILFRSTLDGSWFNDKNGYFYALQFVTFHRLGSRHVLQYEWNNSFQTSPSHNLEEIRLRVLLRQQIWRKWLFYEVGPQVTFPRERDYKYTPGILLRLETIFGAY